MKRWFADLIVTLCVVAFIAATPASATDLEERLNVLLQGEDYRVKGFRAMSLDESLEQIAALLDEHELLLEEHDQLTSEFWRCDFEAEIERELQERPGRYD